MPAVEVSVLAATAVLGYDLLTNRPELKTSDLPRAVSGIACRGSAAAADTELALKVAGVTIAQLFNVTTGFPINDDLIPLNAYCPPGVPMTLLVQDAPATNPINVRLVIQDLV